MGEAKRRKANGIENGFRPSNTSRGNGSEVEWFGPCPDCGGPSNGPATAPELAVAIAENRCKACGRDLK